MEIKDFIMEQYGLPPFPRKTPEAMAYVPFQSYSTATYTPSHGLESGTMFPTLDKPFYGSKCGEHND
ncbi:MAG: spore coat associated protein CotJA [Ruminococcus sp.]|nr:spore coat associated protein CotJA [Ruminococcus sp.]